MGNGGDRQTPGKQDDARYSARELALDELRHPGRTTLASTLEHPCDGMQGPACMLSPPERSDARGELVQRIAAAGAAFGDACVELRIERLIDRSHPSVLLGILLEVIGARVVVAVGGALKALRTAAQLAVSDRAIEQGVKLSVDLAKKRATTEPAHDDDVRIYLSRLAELGAIALQSLTHRVLATATDQELVAFRDGFDASHHTVAIYRRALEDQLQRYQASGVRNIGHRTASRGGGLPPIDRATRCAWLVYPDGRRELALVSDDRQVGLGDSPGRELADSTRVRVLEPEFVEAALAAHAREHHTPPRDIPTAGVPHLQLADVP